MYKYNNEINTSRRVAIYARVSTDHDAQLSALENQKEWYDNILSQYPEWTVVRMYVDEGITGTSARKRPEFMRMINDAFKGEFDLILTREVARFARNTVDTLQYTRDLKAHGVEVFFINDNIRTFDGDGELRLTIMATLAQDESRKTSIRVKAGQDTSMRNGVFYGNGNILGYDRVGEDMVINPEQAETVRMIYDWYIGGFGIRAIKFNLEQLGRTTATGKSNWHESNISKILKNTFYCGIITYHKEYTPDYLEQKKVLNLGEIDYLQVEGRHEPIISKDTFDLAQLIMNTRRSKLPGTNPGKHRNVGLKPPADVWTDILECKCGHRFNRRAWHKTKNGANYGYQCYHTIRTGSIRTRMNKGLSTDGTCNTPMIPAWKLEMVVKHVFKECVHNTDKIISLAQTMLEQHINDKREVDDSPKIIIAQKESELAKLKSRLDALIEMRADNEISKDVFKTKKDEVENKIVKLQTDIAELNAPEDDPEIDMSCTERIKVLKHRLEESVNPDVVVLSDAVIKAFVRKIIANEHGFDIYLRFNDDNDKPIPTSVIGKKGSATVSSFCYQQHRLLSAKVGVSNFVKVQEIVIDLDIAKAYLYSFSTKRRVHRWNDFTISVFI